MNQEIEIPEGHEAKIVGNKVVFEQKESEDEKNWRAVLEYIKDDALRSWLDKLKEQKPFSQEAFNAAKHEALWEEQKPLELSEDERIRKELIDYFRGPSETKVTPADKFKEWHAWLERQKDEAQKQFNLGIQAGKEEVMYEMEKEKQPAEWSEEEMKVLDSIIDDYEKATKSFCGYDGKIMLLKAIRDGEYDLPKQEWSEEDKDYFDAIIAKLEVTQDDAMLTDNQMDFLKSLRP